MHKSHKRSSDSSYPNVARFLVDRGSNRARAIAEVSSPTEKIEPSVLIDVVRDTPPQQRRREEETPFLEGSVAESTLRNQKFAAKRKRRLSPVARKREDRRGPGLGEGCPLVHARPPLLVIPVVMVTPPRRPRAPGHPRTPQTPSPRSRSPRGVPRPPPLSSPLLPPRPRRPYRRPPSRASPPGTRIDPRTSSRSYVFCGECY